MPAPAVRHWPFVARSTELAAVMEALTSPGSDGVLVTGPAGVGKSRLAEVAIEHMVERGEATAVALATPSLRTVPFGAIAHLMPAAAAELGHTGAVGSLQLFGLLRAAIEHATKGRLAVHIDDVHLLDDATTTVLTQLVNARLVAIVATLRTGERVPEGLTWLLRSDRIARVDLAELSRPQLRELVAAALGGDVDATTEASFWDTSQGNTLYARELVLGAIERGVLVRRAGLWTLTEKPSGSRRLVELITSRLASLDADARRVAELLSLCEPVGLGLLEANGWGDAVIALEQAGHLAVTTSSRRFEVRLAHPLIAEILRADMGESTRRRLLMEHVRRIEALGARRRQDAMELSIMRLEAGAHAEVATLLRGARIATAAYDYRNAARLAGAAADEGAGPEASIILGEALYELGRFEESDKAYADGLARCAAEGDEVHLFSLAFSRRRVQFWGMHDTAAAIASLEAVRPRLPPGIFQDGLRLAEADVYTYAGRPREAIAALDEVQFAAPPISTFAAIPRAGALAMLGRTAEAIEMSERAHAEHLTFEYPNEVTHPVLHVIVRSFAMVEAGRLADAYDLAHASYLQAVEERLPLNAIWLVLNMARSMLMQGRLRSAKRWGREALALAESISFRTGRRLAWSVLAVAVRRGESAEEVAHVQHELAACPMDTGFLWPERALGLAVCANRLGRPEEARELVRSAVADAHERGLVTTEAFLRHELARLGEAVDVAGFAELVAASDSPFVAARGEHVTALARGNAKLLGAAAVRLGALGANLYAAEASASAADLLRRDGDTREANAMTAQAEAFGARCEGAFEPFAPQDALVPLTAREREVATLAAEGLQSKEIAARLYLSVRTVSNHLQSAYTKLGVSSRVELQRALARTAPR